jgi:hypothetical protein
MLNIEGLNRLGQVLMADTDEKFVLKVRDCLKFSPFWRNEQKFSE